MTSSCNPLSSGGTRRIVNMAAAALFGLSSGFCAQLAYAVDQSVGSSTSRADVSAGGGLEEITVTARRRNENLQSEPVSIQALTGVQLEQMHVQQLSDITNIANVNFTWQPGFMNSTVPFIRGIGEQDPVLTNDSPVAVYVDGVLLARQIGMNFDFLEPQSVEVDRGPQGSLFGRNTTGGAVSITLPKPTDEFSIAGKAGYASNSEYTARVILNTGLLDNDGLKALVAVQYHSMDGWIRNLNDEDPKHWPGSDETTATYLDLHGNLGSVGDFDVRADYSNSRSLLMSGQTTYASPAAVSYFGSAINTAYGGDPFLVSPTRLGSVYLYPSTPMSTGQFGGTSITLNFPVSDAFNVKTISAYRKWTTDSNPQTVGQGLLYGVVVEPTIFGPAGVQRVSPYTVEAGLGRPEGDVSRQEQFSQELQFSGDLWSTNKYVGGLYAFSEQVSESYYAFLDIPLPPTGTYAFPSYGGVDYWGHSASYAVFLSDTFTPPVLDNKLELTGGVRYTKDIKTLDFLNLPGLNLPTAHHNASFEDPSGDFTAKYQWTPDLMSYVRFANAYKSGGFSGRDAFNAPGYKPETANNWEIGAKTDWLNHRVRLNGDLFYTIYNNKQVTTYAAGLGSNGINESHVVNAGKAVYPGGELELTIAPATGWEVDLNYGHVNPKYKEFLYQPTATSPVQNIAGTAKFPYFSNTSYSIANTYTFPATPIGELSLRVDFNYKSQVYFHPSDTFNPLNELIKAHSENILNGSINLAHIPVWGNKPDLAVSIYGKNLLNKDYVVQAVDYEIISGYDYYATGVFSRPRVVGLTVTGKY